MASVILLTPLAVLWRFGKFPSITRKHLVELAVFMSLLAASGVLLLTARQWESEAAALLPLLVTFLLWAALRFGHRGTLSIMVGLACVGVIASSGRVPWASGSARPSLLETESAIVVVGLMSLMLSAHVAQRRRIDKVCRSPRSGIGTCSRTTRSPCGFMTTKPADAGRERKRPPSLRLLPSGLLDLRLTDICPPEDVPLVKEDVTRARQGLSDHLSDGIAAGTVP